MGRPTVLCANRGISVTNQLLLKKCEQLWSYMEASSARDIDTKVAPKPTRMHPYSIEAGPPLSNENWKVTANASQETSTMSPKLTIEGRLMYLYEYLLAGQHETVSARHTSRICGLALSSTSFCPSSVALSTASAFVSSITTPSWY